MANANSRMQRSHASTIRFSPRLARTVSDFPLSGQDDVSHPDTERELVLWGGFGVETRELGDEGLLSSVEFSAIGGGDVISLGTDCATYG